MGLEPSTVSCSAGISACEKGGRWQPALELLGKMVRFGRKQRKMTEMELAERLGIARSTLQRLEKGDPKVEIGIVFEAATLVGVKLFDSEEKDLRQLSDQMDARIAVLPKHIYKKSKKVVDDF